MGAVEPLPVAGSHGEAPLYEGKENEGTLPTANEVRREGGANMESQMYQQVKEAHA